MNESIKEIRKQIRELQDRLDDLVRANSAYFVLWEECGTWDDYARYYIPIGRVTEDIASSMAKTWRGDDSVLDAGYKEVSEHEYKLYKEAAAIAKIKAGIRELGYCVDEQADAMMDALGYLDLRDIQIRKGLGVTYHWEHFLPEKWISEEDELDEGEEE